MEKLSTDILIIGMGGAAQLAALNAYDANPDLNILIVTKALRGKGGCSRMVQGGFNVVLNQNDSHQKHFTDTLKGGQFINNQNLAKILVESGVLECQRVAYEILDRHRAAAALRESIGSTARKNRREDPSGRWIPRTTYRRRTTGLPRRR